MQFQLKDKKNLFIIGMAAFLVVDAIFVLGWQIRSLVRTSRAARERSQQLQAIKNDVANMEQYRRQLGDLTAVVDTLKENITDEAESTALIERISTIAGAVGVKIQQIRPVFDVDRSSPEGIISVNNEQFGTISFRIVASAGFHQLGAFINRLESKENLFRLTSIEIETDKKNYLIQSVRLSLTSVIRLSDVFTGK